MTVRQLWRRAPVFVQPIDLPVVQVVAPAWPSHTIERDSGSFRLGLFAISLPGIPGTGETTRARRWRRAALNGEGRAIV